MPASNIFDFTISTAVVTVTCSECLEDIEIGDTYYVDISSGSEEKKALIICESCLEDAI